MKKRTIFNLLLVVLIGLLIWMLISGIREPIAFQQQRQRREAAVIDKLIKIRRAQEAYRGITGEFAKNFDTLKQVLTHDSFAMVKVIGDPDDPTNMDAVTYDTTFKLAIDSVNAIGLNLDSLPYVPFTNKVVFDITADTLTYQNTKVTVVEVGVQRKVFMGHWGSPRFKKYDHSYDPNKPIKFGDLNKPILSGNWEN